MPLEIRDKTIFSDIAVNSVILYSIKAENVLLFQDLLWTRVSWWISPGLEVHWLLHAHLDRQGIWLYFCWTWVNVAVFGLDLSVFCCTLSGYPQAKRHWHGPTRYLVVKALFGCIYAALECIWPFLLEIRLDFVCLFLFGLASLNSRGLQRYHKGTPDITDMTRCMVI